METSLSELTRFNICVDGFSGPEGRVYHGHKDGAVNFFGIESLLLGMDDIMSETGKPQGSLKLRSFDQKSSESAEKFKRMAVTRYMNVIDENGQKGEKATFIVQIHFRQNASWQGTVQWVEQGKSKHFRSALELIKLIDEASLKEREALLPQRI